MTKKINFWVYGSGRWAKIIISQLYLVFGKNIFINLITSRDLIDVKKEFSNLGFNQINTVKKNSTPIDRQNNFAIICGKTSSNVENAISAISAGLSLYLEKPFALDSKLLKDVENQAEKKNLQIYCSNVFYFHNRIHKLVFEKTHSTKKKEVKKIKIFWQDTNTGLNSNFKKKYNSSLTAFEDILPHVFPIVAKITDTEDVYVKAIIVERLGQLVKLSLKFGEVDVDLHLERNAERRVRDIVLISDSGSQLINFSDRQPSLHYIEKNLRYSEKNQYGPLALSLIDFVKSSTSKKISEYNNFEYTFRAIDLFPQVDKLYVDECLKSVAYIKSRNNVPQSDIIYLENEISARLSDDAIYCAYLNKRVLNNIKRSLEKIS